MGVAAGIPVFSPQICVSGIFVCLFVICRVSEKAVKVGHWHSGGYGVWL